jgi:hypothetical protein
MMMNVMDVFLLSVVILLNELRMTFSFESWSSAFGLFEDLCGKNGNGVCYL